MKALSTLFSITQHYKDILTFPFDIPGIRDYYTDEVIAEVMAGNPQLDAFLDQYQQTGQYQTEERHVEFGDVVTAIDNKSVVQLDVVNYSGSTHAVLICGRDQSGAYKMFWPREAYDDSYPAISSISEEELSGLPIGSMMVYSKPRADSLL